MWSMETWIFRNHHPSLLPAIGQYMQRLDTIPVLEKSGALYCGYLDTLSPVFFRHSP